MNSFPLKRAALLFLAASVFFPGALSGASAQDASMKVCGEKWQAAKAANATNGLTWPKFLAECRAAGTATSAAAPAARPSPRGKEQQASGKPAQPSTAPERKSLGEPVFPSTVSAKFSDLRPAQARQKTCSEQYQANKANDANGGLRWLEKGGGYWSLCNRKLKAA